MRKEYSPFSILVRSINVYLIVAIYNFNTYKYKMLIYMESISYLLFI